MKRDRKILSIICAFIVAVVPCSAAIQASATESDLVWYTASNLVRIEKKSQEVLLNVLIGNSGKTLHLTFPSCGGFRLNSSESGYFKPDSLQNIEYLSSQTGCVTLKGENEKISVKIDYSQSPWKLYLYGEDGSQTSSFSGDQMYFGFQGTQLKQVKLEGSIADDELLYGLGERFGSLSLNGTKTTLWNTDAWSDEDSSYKNIPILHSSNGYMLFFNSFYKAEADIGLERNDKYSLKFEGPQFDFYVWGESPLSNIQSYTALTGTSVLPPKWALRYWAGASSQTWEANGADQSVSLLQQSLEGYAQLGITNLAAMYGEDTLVNQPEAYTVLNQTRMLAWNNPFIERDKLSSLLPSASIDFSQDQIPVLKNAAGTAYSDSTVIDYSHPNAYALTEALWKQKILAGVRGLMIDYGEYVPESCMADNGMSGSSYHNFFAYDYTKNFYNLFKNTVGDDFILFSRNAVAGSQKWAATFGGDQVGDFSGLRKAVTALMTISSCGFSTWGSDIGGYGTTQNSDVYMRWMQFGAFSPLMRLHGQGNKDPWYFGKNAEETFTTYYWLRENLLNKIYSSAIEANQNGTPMSQSLAVAFPEQKSLSDCEDEYIFCNDFLVCPVTDAGAYYRTVRFPEGNWIDFWTGEVISGGCTKTVDAPQNRSPLYVRSGSTIPVTVSADTLGLTDPMEETTPKTDALLITPPNGSRSSIYHESQENSSSFSSCATDDKTFTVSADSTQQTSVLLAYGVNAIHVWADGVELPRLTQRPINGDTAGYYMDGSLETIIRVPNGQWQSVTIEIAGSTGKDLAANAAFSCVGISDAENILNSDITTVGTISNTQKSSLTVDLGALQEIDRASLKWCGNYAAGYKIMTSTDGVGWQVAADVTSGDGMIDNVAFAPVRARYIRLCSFQSSEFDSFSLYDFSVYGTATSSNIPQLSAVSRFSSATDLPANKVDLSLYGQNDMNSFDIFYGENADTEGLQKSAFADHFITADGYIKHLFDTSKITDYWAQQDKYVTSAVYNKKAYRNFEMECTVQGKDNNNVAYYWPMLVFGIEDPTKWVQQDGGGFATFAYNDGNTGMKGFVNGAYVNTGDPKQHKDAQGYFESESYVYKLKLVVSGSSVTVTVIPQYNWGVQYSYTYNLGSNYTGGYVGFASTGQQCKFWNFKVTDLGGEVRMNAAVSLGSLSANQFLFDTYSGTNADNNGLYGSTFGEKFTILSNAISQHNFDVSTITDYWAQQDKFVTTAVYNQKTYRNFEMEVNCQGQENSVAYYWPMLVFGIQDPTKWVQQDGGGFAASVYNEGNSMLKGFVNGVYKNRYDPTQRHDYSKKSENGFFEAQWYAYNLKIRVSGHKAVVTVTPLYDWGVPYSYTYDLGNDYVGGYVGFASTGQQCKFWNFKVTDLGGEVRLNGSTSLKDTEKAKQLFTTYSGENALQSGLTQAEFTNCFTAADGIRINQSNVSDTFVTTALYNQKAHRNFEMEITCRDIENAAGNSLPMLVFGVENPEKWVNQSGGGFAAYVCTDGQSGFKGCVNGRYTDVTDGIVRNNSGQRTQGYFPGFNETYLLRLRVEGYTATVSVIPKNDKGAGFSYTYYLGNSYRGGQVGFAGTGNQCEFSDFKITDLGNTVCESGVFGDNDLNGSLTSVDMDISKKILLGIMQQKSYMYTDVNHDGTSNIIDLVVLKKRLAGVSAR